MNKTGGSILCTILYLIVVQGSSLKEIAIDIGHNLTIPCPIHKTKEVQWEKEENRKEHPERMTVLENGSLFLMEVDTSDSGNYSCSRENVVDAVRATFRVTVRTPPPPLINVSVRPSTILALILWDVEGNGGYPIINFTAQYRLADSDGPWLPISPNHITPNSRQIEVYKLTPNTTYEFRIWATNQLGRSEVTEVMGTTLNIYQEQELARHLLEGADKFDTRVWAVAVGVVMGTLVLLAFGTCFLLYQECKISTVSEEQEIIELVPNIILNPGFDGNSSNEASAATAMQADENSNNETPQRLNNNTVVQPRNV